MWTFHGACRLIGRGIISSRAGGCQGVFRASERIQDQQGNHTAPLQRDGSGGTGFRYRQVVL